MVAMYWARLDVYVFRTGVMETEVLGTRPSCMEDPGARHPGWGAATKSANLYCTVNCSGVEGPHLITAIVYLGPATESKEE